MARIHDLTNQRFGRLIVVKDTYKRKDGKVIWECKCDCGNTTEVISTSLTRKTGGTKSCGCLKKEGRKELFSSKDFQEKYNKGHKAANIKDISGLRSGLLVAIERTNQKYQNSYLWKCKCDCGNICYTTTSTITEKKKLSCGCLKGSSYEKLIEKLLSANNIPFKREYYIENNYRFDFFVNDKYMIEYDGEQHFRYISFFKRSLEDTRKSDLFKNHYCFENHIPIIRIPYNKDFNFNDLLLESTRFLLTAENEKDYYNGKKEA